MNNELETKVLENFEKISQYIESGIDSSIKFGSENIPILVQEILHFSLTQSIIMAVIFSIAPILYLLNFKRMSSLLIVDDDSSCADLGIFVIGASSALTVTSFIAFIVFLMDVAKITIAPRLFLIEYVADLVK